MPPESKWIKNVPPERRPAYIDTPYFKLGTDFNRETFLDSLTYQPKDGDVFITTYPKNGTTWMQMIVYLLQHDAIPPPNEEAYRKKSKFLEFVGRKDAESLESPGVIKAHLPANLIPWNDKAKYIYIIRNPKDALVSYFFHVKGMDKYFNFTNGSFNDFFDLWLGGQGPYGDYYEFVHSWLAKKDLDNVFIITYEYMKANPREAVKAVAHFLDAEKYGKRVDQDEEFLNQILKYSTVKAMSDFLNANFVKIASTQEDFKFVRKGIVNDWKNMMKREQNKLMNTRFREEAEKNPLLLKLWDNYNWLNDDVN